MTAGFGEEESGGREGGRDKGIRRSFGSALTEEGGDDLDRLGLDDEVLRKGDGLFVTSLR